MVNINDLLNDLEDITYNMCNRNWDNIHKLIVKYRHHIKEKV